MDEFAVVIQILETTRSVEEYRFTGRTAQAVADAIRQTAKMVDTVTSVREASDRLVEALLTELAMRERM